MPDHHGPQRGAGERVGTLSHIGLERAVSHTRVRMPSGPGGTGQVSVVLVWLSLVNCLVVDALGYP